MIFAASREQSLHFCILDSHPWIQPTVDENWREGTSKVQKNTTLDLGFATYCQLLQRRQWQPTPVLLPGKSHGQRSLVGCSPWGHKESDMTEQLHLHFSLSYIGDGNGNLLHCSCLENPRDGGAWWAAVYGVA